MHWQCNECGSRQILYCQCLPNTGSLTSPICVGIHTDGARPQASIRDLRRSRREDGMMNHDGRVLVVVLVRATTT